MTVASLQFLAFLASAHVVHSALPERWRAGFLLAASWAFYAVAGGLHLLFALLVATAVAASAGLQLGGDKPLAHRRTVFWAAVAAELALLAGFKYIPALLHAAGVPGTPLLVTVGVSYYVFQAISYLADVYLDVQPPARDLTRFALYLAFFPKLLQGPIERVGDLLPQLARGYRFDYAEARAGLALVGWGLFEKLVVADRAGAFVDGVYGEVQRHAGLPLLTATYYYAVQILFDFAGYTDVALGAALLFGIRLTQNFDRPYLATSIAEFWRRWHISFSRWLLDYLFKPLQLGWRGLGTWSTPLALLATFLVSGVWHGATAGFVLWGLLHGVYLAVAALAAPHRKRLVRALGRERLQTPRALQVLVTFHLVCAAWVFFRASSVQDALHVLTHAWDARPAGTPAGAWIVDALLLGRSPGELVILVSALVAAAAVSAFRHRAAARVPAWPLRWAAYGALVVALMLFHAPGPGSFIYARF
jgi:D-alanyl-lipoteichoic acid acyltransferase DltB (MBOAT superfamily)